MRVRRNPFFFRFSERLGSDANFLKLFSPGVLEVFSPATIWETTNVIRSSPGGGKTSVLRLFTPNSLVALDAYQDIPPYDELYGKLRELDAIQDSGPIVLGVMLSCVNDFSSLEDLNLSDVQKERLFIALLNARIILAVLRSALAISQYKYPEDVDKIQLRCAPGIDLPKGVPFEGSGLDYYTWARNIEEGICKEIDSVLPFSSEHFMGHNTLFSLWLATSETLLCDGVPVAKRVIIMLDDVQELASQQREKLISLVSTSRTPTNIWMAERLEALSTEDWFSEGSKGGREHNTIYLESYWRKFPARFERFAKDVADRRTDSASQGEITSFAGCLNDAIGSTEIDKIAPGAIETQISHIRNRISYTNKYDEWVSSKEEFVGSPYERLVEWRSLEILIERDIQKRQKTFDFYELTEEELQANEKSNIHTAAKLFLNGDLGLPFYYSFARLSRMSSSNIDQFLALAGNVFEEITSASILNFSRIIPRISADRQEKILRNVIEKKHQEIIRSIPNSIDIRSLLEGIGDVCQEETNKPTAPYAPGVTGVAILMSDRARLRDPEVLRKNELYARLAFALSTCLSQNVLVDRLNHKCKGREWMVLYLNRMSCVHYNLPLDYGGFKEKSLDDLCDWIEKGSRQFRKREIRPWF